MHFKAVSADHIHLLLTDSSTLDPMELTHLPIESASFLGDSEASVCAVGHT